jgi:hypothetical protein
MKNNTPPIDLFDAIVLNSTADNIVEVRCKNKNSFMSHIFADDQYSSKPIQVYRKNKLNNWHLVGVINHRRILSNGHC